MSFPLHFALNTHAPDTMRITAAADGARPAYQITTRREPGEACAAFYRRTKAEAHRLWSRSEFKQHVEIECHYGETAGNPRFDDERQNTLYALRLAMYDRDGDVAVQAMRTLNRMQGLVPFGA